MKRAGVALLCLLLRAGAVEDPLALNDPLRQLIVDTTTRGDGDFLTRSETSTSVLTLTDPERTADALDAATALTPRDSLERFRHVSDSNAIPQLEALLRQHPGRGPGWQLLGEMRFRQRDYAGAEAAFRQAHDLMPLEGKTLNDLAASLTMQNKLVEAGGLLETELARRPGNQAARFNLACVAVRRGRPAGALEQLKRLEKERWAELSLHLTDSDLDPLRRLPEFVALQARVTAARSLPAGPRQGI